MHWPTESILRHEDRHSGCSAIMQLDANLVERDWRWNCQRSFEMSLGGGMAELFFIDTNPFVQKYYDRPWANFTGRC